MSESGAAGPRCAALVGPYLSGKTSLLESLLFVSGAIPRKGTVKEKNTVGDTSPESREREMSVELSVGGAEYLGQRWAFIDCPGSVELTQETFNALAAVDVAVIVYEAATDRAMTLLPLMKVLDEREIPHVLFINKIDTVQVQIRDVVAELQAISDRPVILRQLPIQEGDEVTGYVDLVSKQAYKYKAGNESEPIPIPDSMGEEILAARTEMLESLADFDDVLLEQLLEDTIPSHEEITAHIEKNMAEGNIVPVFLGAGERDLGVRRLLKALNDEIPSPEKTAKRLGIPESGEVVAQVFKTVHAAHSGKLSIVRVWRGELSDGITVNGSRIGGVMALMGSQQNKIAKAEQGEVVALARMDEIKTGDILTPSGTPPEEFAPWSAPLFPVYSMAITAEDRNDEVKLSGGLQKLAQEDPSLSFDHNPDTHEMVLWGQGEIHLRLALDRLRSKYNVSVVPTRPHVPYKETIRKSVSQHGRFKRQSGGHGQFGDVHIDIKPMSRGEGFQFADKIVGGSVPKQYIPAVENGVKEYLATGPLGFPVVDVSVTLTDGQYHAVDSSEQAFKTAGRIAMTEGMTKCNPVLLEPIYKVDIDVPNEHTNKIHGLVSSRRGQILGFSPKEGWKGWDTLSANMPQSEIYDLIVELRSLTLGVGTYHSSFDHLQELTGRLADKVLEDKAEVAAS